MMDTFTYFLLMFIREEVIIPIMLFGMIFHKREPYAKAMCFFCVIIIFNMFLKNIFKVPLFPHLGNGYAFPSGHMHVSAIFYGYIFYKVHDWKVRSLLAFIMCGIGFSLVYRNYHTWIDVFGAAAFAIAEIAIYRYLEKNNSTRFITIFTLIFCISIMFALFLCMRLELMDG